MHCGHMVTMFRERFSDREFTVYRCLFINDPEYEYDPDDYDHIYVVVKETASGTHYIVESWNLKFAPRFRIARMDGGQHVPDSCFFAFNPEYHPATPRE